jgi:hypothetical protein
MEKAKRARKAETPKQPSLCLRLRAPYLYPDPTGPALALVLCLLLMGSSDHSIAQHPPTDHPPRLGDCEEGGGEGSAEDGATQEPEGRGRRS